MITKEQKKQIVSAIKDAEQNYPSGIKLATALNISTAQLSRVKNGELERVLSDANWISVACKLQVNLNKKSQLNIANTPVFSYISIQLKACQHNSMSGLLCDAADIGKTFAAKYYARHNKNAFYVDCSQSKTKQKLIRHMASEMGLNGSGRLAQVYNELVYYIRTLTSPSPIFILDEAGDLDYGAWLELKALWNATEYSCAWYMMGAEGLKAKIEGNLGRNKVGYAEIFSRYGNRFQKITPSGDKAEKSFAKQQTAMIAKANGITDVQKLFARTDGSLRRVYIEIQKRKTAV